MKRKLFVAAFEKAKNLSGKETKHGLSNYLSEILDFSVNHVTLVRYFEKYVEGNDEVTFNPNSELLDAISKYLDYENFEDFVRRNNSERDLVVDVNTNITDQLDESATKFGTLKRTQRFVRRNRIVLSVILLLVLSYAGYDYVTRERWMIWVNDEYVEVKFDAQKLANGTLKGFKQERIDNFKQVNPDCNYPFFKQDGSENLWYGKNSSGELEFFTDLGLHPDTGKTLKHITTYMIQKYICPEFKK